MPVSANTNFYEGGQDLRYKYLSANDVIYVADSFLTNAGLFTKYAGTLWTWGDNSYGRLGLGDNTSRSSPVQVGSLNNWSQIDFGEESHAVALRTNGTLWSWGYNVEGQLGLGNTTSISSPVQVGALTNWLRVSSGDRHCLAVKTDGTLWSWGQNSIGQLGLNDRTHRSSPVQVGALTNWKEVSCGTSFSVAIKTDGTIWSWGYNNSGQLGLGNSGAGTNRSSPVQVGSLTDWSQVTTYFEHCLAVKTDGTLWAWGRNLSGTSTGGQLGLGDTTARSSPTQVGTLTDWYQVSTGQEHTHAVKTNGTLWAWGNNIDGRLGLGNTTHRSSPVQLGSLTNWSFVSVGQTHATSIKTDGTLWAWGQNSAGQLGLGDTTLRSSPVQVGTTTYWIRASSGLSGSASIIR